jgi:hypothetical protein
MQDAYPFQVWLVVPFICFVVILCILWLILPFAVFGIKGRLDRILAELQTLNINSDRAASLSESKIIIRKKPPPSACPP